MFEAQLTQYILTAIRPELEDLVKEVMERQQKATETLVVDYHEAGRMIGTTYSGIRKMIARGELTPVRRGRRVGVAVADLKAHAANKVQRSPLAT